MAHFFRETVVIAVAFMVTFLTPECVIIRTSAMDDVDLSSYVRSQFFTYQPDPEMSMNASEIIQYHGYPAEEYEIETEDGYRIYIQRIPYGRHSTNRTSRPVVILQHGLLASSTNWITNLPHQSLGFILADAGYDVWLGNMRGNFYGLRHRELPVSSKEFWDFTFDEMAEYDLPATVNKALEVSGQDQVVYIGHSQGTLIGFAKFSSDLEFANKVRLFIAMGPVAFVGNMKSPPLRLLAPFSTELAFLFRLFGYRDFLPDYPFIKYIARTFCEEHPVPAAICENIFFLLAGYDFAQMNSTRLDVYMAHTPAGTSTQNMFHFAQLVHSGRCQKYDYGSKKGNLEHYGEQTPPEYPLSSMRVPVALLYSDNDWLATPTDVMRLKVELNSVVDTYRVPYHNWDHLDFIWGIEANKYVYPEVLRLIQDHVKTWHSARQALTPYL